MPKLARWEWLLVAAGAVAALLLFPHYGLGWDTGVQAEYGEHVLDYFLSGFRDRQAVDGPGLLPYYGTLFELPSAAVHRVLGLDRFALRGLLTALVALSTLPPLVRLGRMLGGERTAAFAAAALLAWPAFVGHAFINSKDVPLAAAVTWAMWAIARLTVAGDLRARSFVLLGVCIGAALSVRVGAVFVLIYLGATVAFSAWQRLPAERPRPRARDLAIWSALAAILAWAIVVLPWPYAHQSPLLGPLRAFALARAFPNAYPTLLAGVSIPSDQLPWHYVPRYLFLQTPPVLLALGAAGLVRLVRSLVRAPRSRPARLAFLVLLWPAFPLALVVLTHPNVYDGARHLLFVLPGLALAAGHGADGLCRLLAPRVGRAAVALAALPLALPALAIVRWHPYEYAYLSALAGDRATLHERYETDYWATSYQSVAEWLNRQQAASATPLRVLVAANDHSWVALARFLDPRIVWKPTMTWSDARSVPGGYDYYVGTVRYGLHRNFPDAPVAFEVRRDGVLLCVVRRGG